MGQAFAHGKRVPVTVVKVGPCVVTQIRKEKDSYVVQIGFGEKKIKNISKPLLGHLRGVINKKDQKAPRFLYDARVNEEPQYKIGDVISASDVFSSGDNIFVTGISKGKGFAGVVKRWHFAGGPKTHGQSDRQRAPGSIGQGTTPGRVFKGKKMAGRMGGDRVTLKNLKVLEIGKEENVLTISGPVPGKKLGLLILRKK